MIDCFPPKFPPKTPPKPPTFPTSLLAISPSLNFLPVLQLVRAIGMRFHRETVILPIYNSKIIDTGYTLQSVNFSCFGTDAHLNQRIWIAIPIIPSHRRSHREAHLHSVPHYDYSTIALDIKKGKMCYYVRQLFFRTRIPVIFMWDRGIVWRKKFSFTFFTPCIQCHYFFLEFLLWDL